MSPLPRGTYYRMRTYPSGKKVRLAIAPNGRILESTLVVSKTNVGKTNRTRTGRSLAKRRRRISG